MQPRAALITGAGRGYGLELALALAARGAHVMGVARSEEARAAFARAVGESGTPITGDVTGEPLSQAIHAALAARDQPLDLLVNNAGPLDREQTDRQTGSQPVADVGRK